MKSLVQARPALCQAACHAGGTACVLLASALLFACTPDAIDVVQMPDMAIEDPHIDPKTIFEMQAKPALTQTGSPPCQGCHRTRQEPYAPFLEDGKEYAELTTYSSAKFMTPKPEDSPLLTKGMHMGPALGAGYNPVLNWLTVESVARSKLSTTQTSVTPSVAVRPGDFFLDLEKLVLDPLAKITFTLEQKSGKIYRVSNLKLTAGPATGIHNKHPIFVLFSYGTAVRDPADSLSDVDMMVPAKGSATIGTGTVILTDVPLNARIAVAFEKIEQVMPMPITNFNCKAPDVFLSKVKPTLQSPCASTCHGAGASDPRAQQAQGAFDMSQASSADQAVLKQFCFRTLGRIDTVNPLKSPLSLQPTPADKGGVPNHPYKLPGSGYMSFQDAVSQWAAAEK